MLPLPASGAPALLPPVPSSATSATSAPLLLLLLLLLLVHCRAEHGIEPGG